MLKLVIILTPTEPFLTFREALKQLDDQYPDMFQVDLFSTTELDTSQEVYASCDDASAEADFILINIFGSLSFFKSFHRYYETYQGKKKFYINTTIEEEVSELLPQCGIMPEDFNTIFQYYKADGTGNFGNLLKWLCNQFGTGDLPVAEPVLPVWSGVYDPDIDVSDEESYLESLRSSPKPVIGILMNVMLMQKENRRHIDALIRAVRKTGALPLCVFSELVPNEHLGSEGIKAAMERYMLYEGEPVVDAIINTVGHSVSIIASPGDGSKARETSIFETFRVPVFQVMTTMQTYEEWENSVKGLDSLSLSWSVFQPEFDGQVITYPIATTEKEETELGVRKYAQPIMDRVERIAALAVNWAKLRHMDNRDKKIAIILHNNPPRNDNIGGAAGLDTPVSVYDMVQRFEDIGIRTEYPFKDGKDIIDRIIAGLTNDGRWMSPESMLERSIDTVKKATYQEWFDAFIPRVQENLVKYWEKPVGDFMAVDDQLLVPGILNGHIFIGLQPPRALEDKAEEMYHNTDIPCPHQYIAFYNWVEKIFQANVIIHVGTHGTIEWLPGKEVGLSKNCFSDITIGTLPHLYPYVIDAVGEGTQAKRRTYATLLDHMIPSMVESGVYEELEKMDDLMRQYYHVRAADPQKLPLVIEEILDLATKMELNNDIGISEAEMKADPEGCVHKFHSWVTNVQASDINDGFHIFGKIPEGDRLRNMLKMLVRTRNGEIPSLRTGVCEMMGYDYDALLATPDTPTKDGRSYGILLMEADRIGREIFLALEEQDYSADAIDEIVTRFQNGYSGDTIRLKICLRYVCTVVKSKVMRITDEMDHLLDGVNGRFVPPGPSGCPTRGNAGILPTGRNFYSVDPGAMPSRFSWETGKVLANQLIERYLADDGKYPESVSVLCYATESMRNYGDDIADTFYLLGVRPVWLGNTDRIIDVEAIPMEELGRPRIDVTLRITGLFRDAFPNLIERVEDAVNLVAALDEPWEMNYVKKHVDEEVAALVEKGVNLELAKEQSLLRVFGDAPGAYGAGVNNVVVSKKWNDVTDLGTVYTTWGCHAYSSKYHGEKMPEVFSLRMKKTSVAVKNESTREFDMLDGDDFYNYFGGMVAAITTHSGEQKPAYVPCTGDTDHIETLTLHEEASRVMRAKVNNPKWIEGLKKHGYRGAKQISGMVDYAFGWDATTNVIDDWMYNAIADRYVFNKENADWIKEVNPWAMHSITERLLEANQRGMWHASEEQIEKLKDIYLQMEGTLENC